MSSDVKPSGPSPASTSSSFPVHGVRIFTYPKIIFIWPTMVAAIISAIIMAVTGDPTEDPRKAHARALQEQSAAAVAQEQAGEAQAPNAAQPTGDGVSGTTAETTRPPKRFTSAQNVAGMIFLVTLLLNLIIISVDFPRFTIIAIFLGSAVLILGFLYLNVHFDLLHPLSNALESIYAVANASFYGWIATIILINFAVIWATRYLDYWVVMPNEILHHHGPFSDLERFPTFNLKFDKEIPDILEYLLLGSGRLVLHVANERRSIVLENVLWISSKEAELKKIMSRLDVRVSTDQEVSGIP